MFLTKIWSGFNYEKHNIHSLLYFFSFEEIVGHHDIFTGSEATDFGEHLTSHQMERFDDEL